jgi:hypothetical protein
MYADILGPDGTENNMGGTRQFLFFARHDDIATFAAPDPQDAETEDQYVIGTAHTLKATKKFAKIYCTVDTSELEAALQGERDGKSNKLTLKFWHPGSKKDIIRFQNNIKNDKTLWIVPLSDGTMIQMGDEFWTCDVSPNFKANKNSGSKGTEFTVECMMPSILIYEATVPLTPAV